MKRTLILSTLVYAAVLSCGAGFPACAQERGLESPRHTGNGTLAVSPAVIMLRGEAGQSTTQRMLLTNGTSRPFSFELIAEDVVVRDGKRYLAPAGETAGSIAATAVFSQRSVTVPAGGSVQVDVTFTIPPRTAIRAVTALFHGKDTIVRGKVPMTVSLGTLMTFALSDAIGVDAGAPVVTPQSATSNAAFSEPFVNSGTEPFVAKGIVAILDANGTLVGKAPLESRRVLPGEQVSLHGEFAGELARGKYRVLLTCDAGGKVITRSAETVVR